MNQTRPSTVVTRHQGAHLELWRTGVTGTVHHRLHVPPAHQLAHEVARLVDAYTAAGLELPADLTAALNRADDLRAKAAAPAPDASADRREVVDRLATGQDAARQLAALAKSNAAVRQAEHAEQSAAYTDAAHEALRVGLRKLHDLGDELLEPLKAAAAACLTDPGRRESEARWEALHALAAELRRRGLVAYAEGAQTIDQRFAAPDLVHFWTLDTCRVTRLVATENLGSGILGEYHAATDPRPLDLPTVAALAADWLPGVLTAAETVAAADAALERQAEAIAAA